MSPEVPWESLPQRNSDESAMSVQQRRYRRRWWRRGIAAFIILVVPLLLWYLIAHTDVVTPLLESAAPIQEGVDWVLADPQRALMALAVLIIPNLGLYFFIFEDRY